MGYVERERERERRISDRMNINTQRVAD